MFMKQAPDPNLETKRTHIVLNIGSGSGQVKRTVNALRLAH